MAGSLSNSSRCSGASTITPEKRDSGKLAFARPNPKVKETLALTFSPSGGTIGSLDIPVDIGVRAEKEVIQ